MSASAINSQPPTINFSDSLLHRAVKSAVRWREQVVELDEAVGVGGLAGAGGSWASEGGGALQLAGELGAPLALMK